MLECKLPGILFVSACHWLTAVSTATSTFPSTRGVFDGNLWAPVSEQTAMEEAYSGFNDPPPRPGLSRGSGTASRGEA